MSRIWWQTRGEKKLRENKRGQSSKLVNATHSASVVSSLQIWINCSIFTSISNFYISIKSFNSRHHIVSIRRTFLNSVTSTFCWFSMIPWKLLMVDMRLILWTNLDQLQHFIPVNSQQHPINCIRKCILPPSFWPCISGADPFSFPDKELEIQMLNLNKRIDSDI